MLQAGRYRDQISVCRTCRHVLDHYIRTLFLLADGEFRNRFPCILDYQAWAYEGPARTGRC
jgi:hypothetical protein